MSDDDTGRAGMEGMEALFHGRKGDKGDKGEPGMTTGAKQAFIFLTLLTLLLAAAGLLLGVREIRQVQSEVRAQCKFDGDLGSAPVALNPATSKPSLLGVTIVSDARVAWRGLNCAGQLPSPAPSFAHWAKIYHLPSR